MKLVFRDFTVVMYSEYFFDGGKSLKGVISLLLLLLAVPSFTEDLSADLFLLYDRSLPFLV